MEPGIYSMPEAQYRAAEGISKSDLDWIAPPNKPAHFKAYRDGLRTRIETPAMRLGSMTHRLLLEPDSFKDAFIVRPEGMKFSTKEGMAWKAAQTVPIVEKEEAEQIRGMVDAVWSHPLAKRLLAEGVFEQSLFAKDGDEILRKGRLDALTKGNIIPDIKTTDSADADEFSRKLANYRYEVQAAYYIDLCRLLDIEKEAFVFICVEKEPPHDVACFSLEEDAIQAGRMQYQRDLALYKSCMESNSWPGSGDEIQPIGLPRWVRKQFEAIA